jgi:hypothetical protein
LHLNFARSFVWVRERGRGGGLSEDPTAAKPHQKNSISVESTMTLMIDEQRAVGLLSFLIKTICLKSKVPATKFCKSLALIE